MRKTVFALALSAGLAGFSFGTAAQEPAPRKLQVTFNADGTVTLAAQGVTTREVMAEWARQCRCYVVNAEKLTGGMLPVPVAFDHAAQGTVLASLLRSAAGYTLTPQRPDSPSPSQYETILILATSSPSASAYTPAYTPAAPMVAPIVTPGSPDDEIPPAPTKIDPNPNAPSTQPPPTRMPPANQPFVPMINTQPGTPSAPGNVPGMPTAVPNGKGGLNPPLSGPGRGGQPQ